MKMVDTVAKVDRSEEHTSELQSQSNLVCRLLLEKKNRNKFDACLPTSSASSCYESTVLYLFVSGHRDHRDLHSFPTRRSSDLTRPGGIVRSHQTPWPCASSAAASSRARSRSWLA